MTPHIVRIPDITDDDMAPMWVGTQNNLSFRGVSPRIESQSGTDPFSAVPTPPGRRLADGEPGNFIVEPGPAVPSPTGPRPAQGGAPTDIFRQQQQQTPQPPPQPQPQNPELGSMQQPQQQPQRPVLLGTPKPQSAVSDAAIEPAQPTVAQLRLAPRISPQPASLSIKPGEEKLWNVIGMDVDGLEADNITLHYDPHALDVAEVTFGSAIVTDPKQPPIAKVDASNGIITLFSSNGKPLVLRSGGELATIRVHGGMMGDTYLVLDDPKLHKAGGALVESAISGGRAKVE
jgi:hypothetical protein